MTLEVHRNAILGHFAGLEISQACNANPRIYDVKQVVYYHSVNIMVMGDGGLIKSLSLQFMLSPMSRCYASYSPDHLYHLEALIAQ